MAERIHRYAEVAGVAPVVAITTGTAYQALTGRLVGHQRWGEADWACEGLPWSTSTRPRPAAGPRPSWWSPTRSPISGGAVDRSIDDVAAMVVCGTLRFDDQSA